MEYHFRLLEPVNEPVEGFWVPGAQEGCTFQPSDLVKLLPLVGSPRFQKGSFRLKLVGIDSFAAQTGKTLSEMNSTVVASLRKCTPMATSSHIRVLKTRTSEWAYNAVRNVAEQYSKEAWVTEWSPLQRAGKTTLIFQMFMAKVEIIEAVNIMRASAWVYWQAIDTTETYTLFNVRWNPASSYPHVLKKKYYTPLHFTTFATPGSVAIPPDSTTCQHCMTSFYDKEEATAGCLTSPTSRKGASRCRCHCTGSRWRLLRTPARFWCTGLLWGRT